MTIGTVKTVTIDNSPERKLTPVKVVMKLDDKYGANLKKDSKASLSTVGVLGDTVVDINSQFAVGPRLQDGDVLKTLETPSLTDVVKASQGTIESLNVILAKMNVIVDNIQSGKGSIGQLINNPDLYNKANKTVDELLTLEKNLNAGTGLDRQADDRRYAVQPVERHSCEAGEHCEFGGQRQGHGGDAAEGRCAVQEPELDGGACELAAGGCGRGQGRAGVDAEGSEVPAGPEQYAGAGEYAGVRHQ